MRIGGCQNTGISISEKIGGSLGGGGGYRMRFTEHRMWMLTSDTPHVMRSLAACRAAAVGCVCMKDPMNKIPTDLMFQFAT